MIGRKQSTLLDLEFINPSKIRHQCNGTLEWMWYPCFAIYSTIISQSVSSPAPVITLFCCPTLILYFPDSRIDALKCKTRVETCRGLGCADSLEEDFRKEYGFGRTTIHVFLVFVPGRRRGLMMGVHLTCDDRS
jgi:hypothetical protein